MPNDIDSYTVRLGYEFKHSFNAHLKLRQNFRYFWNRSSSDHESRPSFLDADDRTLALNALSASSRNEGLRTDAARDAFFNTGSITHTVSGGVDYRLTHNRNDLGLATEPVFLDVFSPNYGSLPRYNIVPLVFRKSHDSDLGFYLQEQARFFDKMTVTLGGRYDLSNYDDSRDLLGDFNTQAFTPKAGLTYEFVKGVALYGNYSRSYFPQFGSFDSTGAQVDPEEGNNWEAGLKFELLGGKLTGLLSAFHLTRENVATPNLTTPEPDDVIVTGKQRARGIEAEVQAVLMPGLEFTTAYAYLDAHITADNVLPVGARLQGAAEHTLNAFLKYTIQEGTFHGLGVGGGGYLISKAPGDGTYGVGGPKFDLPAYGLVNLATYYNHGPFSAQVNFNNVLDRRYFSGGGGDVYIQPGEPFNVRATASWKF